MSKGEAKSWFSYDPDAPSSPRRMALLIGSGVALLLVTLWLFSDDSPPPESSNAPAADPRPPSAAPVQPAAPAAQGSAQTTAVSQLTLHGVSGFGANGAAIISIAGRTQRLIRTGRPVAPGVTLVSVASTHVMLDDRGNAIRLPFPEGGAPTSVPDANVRVSAAPASSRSRTNPDALDYMAAMTAHESAGRFQGYRLNPGTIPPAFASAGLQPGDIVLSVGATRLEGPDDLERIPRELSLGPSIEITFLRDGREQTARVGQR